MELKQRLRNILVAADQFFGSVITLGACWPDETPSSYAYRLEQRHKKIGIFMRPKIDRVFFLLFKQVDHCRKSYQEEVERRQMPLDLRDEKVREVYMKK